jgi:hypothetical protein
VQNEKIRPVSVKGSRKKPPVYVTMVLDGSGSMGAYKADTIGGFNAYIEGLKEDKKSTYFVSLLVFGSNLYQIYTAAPLKKVSALNGEVYRTYGNTRLYDAVGQAVKDTEQSLEGQSAKCLICILTDGEENASRDYTRDSIMKLISEKEAEGNWTFTYVGADSNSWKAAGAIGIRSGNTASYQVSDTVGSFRDIAHATRSFSGGASGQSVDFYSTVRANSLDVIDPNAPVDSRTDPD